MTSINVNPPTNFLFKLSLTKGINLLRLGNNPVKINGNDIIKFDDYSGEFILDLASYCDNMTFSVSLSEFERKQFAEELSKIISIMK